MKDNESAAAKLIKEARELLARMEHLQNIGHGTNAPLHEEFQAEVQRNDLQDLEMALEGAEDATFDVFVEPDNLTVLADFKPPSGEGSPFPLDRVVEILRQKNIVHGILWSEIKRCLVEANVDKKVLSNVVIARGTPPVAYRPEYFQLLKYFQATKFSPKPFQQTVDFKDYSPFVMVKKSDPLAEKIPERGGSHGTDVFGNSIAFSTEVPPGWIPGENVRVTDKALTADVEGRLLLEKNVISVSEVLILDEGVSYKTGNIHFHGDVVVKKEVLPGFKIESGGSLVAESALDAYQIKVGEDLTALGGIIGNKEGRIEVKGAVQGKFVENVYLLAKKDVQITNSVLNSIIKTNGKLVLGEKGIVAGGRVSALHGVDVFQISTPTGPRTEISCGLEFQTMAQILLIKEQNKELATQATKLETAAANAGINRTELIAEAAKLRRRVDEATESARRMLQHMDQDENATVTIRGKVFPGTLIEICNVSFIVTQTMGSIRFFLDKRKGLLGFYSLDPPKNSPKR